MPVPDTMFDPYGTQGKLMKQVGQFLQMWPRLDDTIDSPRGAQLEDTPPHYAQWPEDEVARTPWKDFYQRRFTHWGMIRDQ